MRTKIVVTVLTLALTVAGLSTNVGAQTLTSTQRQAAEAAENYIETGTFSKVGLISQLTSPFGDNFSLTDARIAVDSVNINWAREAIDAATAHLDRTSYSEQALFDRLT